MRKYTLIILVLIGIALSGCGLGATAALVGEAMKDEEKPEEQVSPEIVLKTDLTGKTKKGDIFVNYGITDVNADLCNVSFFYSIGDGENRACTGQTDYPDYMVTRNLQAGKTSPEYYTFCWDTAYDLGNTVAENVRLYLTVSDGTFTDSTNTGLFTVSNTSGPRAVVSTPANSKGGYVSIFYTLSDFESDTAYVKVSYSEDNSNWFDCTRVTDEGDNTTGLATSPLGEEHLFVWDSAVDLDPRRCDVIVRVEPYDNEKGETGYTDPFSVDNNESPVVVINNLPDIGIGNSTDSSPVPVPYVLFDSNSDPVDLKVEFSLDNVIFETCTEAPARSDGTDSLASSPSGFPHIFAWNAVSDIEESLQNASVFVRITPVETADNSVRGNVAWSNWFLVDKTFVKHPPLAIITPPSGVQSGNVYIDYRLIDYGVDAVCSVLVEYKLSGETDFTLAAEAAGLGNGTEGLSASPSGVSHLFVWASAVDLPSAAKDNVVIRITPTDELGDNGSSTETSQFSVNNNTSPTAFNVTGPSVTGSGTVEIDYYLRDSDSDLCSVTVEYSTDGGKSFQGATGAQVFGHDGVTGLSSSPTGEAHTFMWDSEKNLGPKVFPSVYVRITPRDTMQGTAGSSNSFSVDNNRQPYATMLDYPENGGGGYLSFTYEIVDCGSDLARIDVYYTTVSSPAPGDWKTAREAPVPTSEGKTGLATSPSGEEHIFYWDSLADLGAVEASVKFKIIPYDQYGSPLEQNKAETPSFVVDNTSARNNPPLAVVSVEEGVHSGEVVIVYSLVDVESDTCSVVVKYRTNQSADWSTCPTCTPASEPYHEGTTGLSSGPGSGRVHIFVWDTEADLGGNNYPEVKVRVTPSDEESQGTSGSSKLFSVYNNSAPVLSIQNAPPMNQSEQTMDILFQYTLADAQRDTVNITPEYSIDGGFTFYPAAEALDCSVSQGTEGLSSGFSASPSTHYFVWDSGKDLRHFGPSGGQVVFRITPRDTETGAGSQVNVLLDNNDPPSAYLKTPSGLKNGTALLAYTLFDESSDPADVLFEYSSNGGSTWGNASADASHASHDGVEALQTAPGGYSHYFAWDSSADLPGVTGQPVLIRVTPYDTSDSDVGSAGMTAVFYVSNNSRPRVSPLSLSGTQSGNVTFLYSLFDEDSDTCTIDVHYSLDNGSTWNAATAASGAVSGLAASPSGTAHSFVWDSLLDADAVYLPGVRVRFTPSDSATGAGNECVISLLDNNTPPSAQITDLPSSVSSVVPVHYRLSDQASHLAEVTVEYSTDGGSSWNDCTEAPGGVSEGTSSLATSPAGISHLFSWDTISDIAGVEGAVTIRITPADYDSGSSTTTNTFAVNNEGLAGNILPTAAISDPNSPARDAVSISYTLYDANGDKLGIYPGYSLDSGGTWIPATEKAGGSSEGTSNLAATPSGQVHVFEWDSTADLGNASLSGVAFRVVPFDSFDNGASAETNLFTVDNEPPYVVTAIHNVTYDATGKTIDVYYSESVDSTAASEAASYSIGTANPAVVQVMNASFVRLVFTQRITPGSDTLSIRDLKDLAGNEVDVVSAVAIVPLDSTAPGLSSVLAWAVTGPLGDFVNVTFTENVLAEDAQALSNYEFEHPTGTTVPLTGGSVTYYPFANTAVISLPFELDYGESFTIAVNDIRDLSGNSVPAGSTFSGAVGGDGTAPSALKVLQEAGLDNTGRTVTVLFDEALWNSSALQPLNYSFSNGAVAASVDMLDNGQGVRLTLASSIVPGVTTLSVNGIRDLARNAMIPAGGLAISSTDTVIPFISQATAIAVSGRLNDILTVKFSEPVIESEALDLTSYTFRHPGTIKMNLLGSSATYNASSFTVTIVLDNASTPSNLKYDESFQVQVENVHDLAGNIVNPGSTFTDDVTGDATGPIVQSVYQNLDVDPEGKTVDILFSEALDSTTAQAPSSFGSSGIPSATAATLLGNASAVRVVFSAALVPGTDTLAVGNVSDLAGNVMTPVSGLSLSSRAPGAPYGLQTMDKTHESITWTWTDNSSSETSFELMDAAGSVLKVLPAGCTSCVEAGLSENAYYTRMVRAVNGSYRSAPSASASDRTLLAAPDDDDVTAVAGVDNVSVTVTTPANQDCGSTGAFFDSILGGAPDGDWSQNYTYDLSGLTPNTTYAFRARLRNADGLATDYNPTEVEVYTLASAPDNLTVGSATSSTLSLQWDASGNPGWTRYVLERATSPSGPFTGVFTGTATSHQDTGLSVSTSYYYRVKAVSIRSKSTAYAALAGGATTSDLPVTLEAADSGTGWVKWEWTDSAPGSQQYELRNSSGGVIATLTDCNSYVENGLDENEAYVRYVYRDGVSSAWVTAYTRISDPANASFTTIADSPTQVTLQAAAPPNNSSGVTGASFEKVPPSGTGGDGPGWLSSAYSYAFSDLKPNTTYAWRVKLRNRAGVPTAYAGPKSLCTPANSPGAVEFGAVTTTSISARWNTSGNPAGTVYELERRTGASAYAQVYQGTDAFYFDSGLSDGTTYYYRVRAISHAGDNTSWTSEASTRTSGLFKPSNFTAASSNANSITWEWTDNSSTETGWEVVDHMFGLVVTTAVSGENSAVETGLIENTEYTRCVRAVEGATRGPASDPVTVWTGLDAPLDGEFAVTVRGSGRMDMTVAQPPNPTAGQTSAMFECLECASFSSPWEHDYSYIVVGLDPNTTYTWRVKYRSAQGDSSDYNPTPVAVCTFAKKPGAPQFDNLTDTTVDVYWEESGNPAGTIYELERRRYDEGAYSQMYYGTDTDYSDSGLTDDATYYYRVRAFNHAGDNTAYVESMVNTIIQAPDAPVNPVPADAASGLPVTTTLDWDNSSRAEGYYVWFGDSYPPAYNGTVADSQFDPGTLAYGTSYYWKVVAYNAGGNSSEAEWSFATGTVEGVTNLKGYFWSYVMGGSEFTNATWWSVHQIHFEWECASLATGFYWYFGTSASPTAADYTNFTTDNHTDIHSPVDGANYFFIKSTDGLTNSTAGVMVYYYDSAAPVVSGAHLQSGASHAAADGYDNAGGIVAGTTSVYMDYDTITEANPDCTSFTLTVTGGSGGTTLWNGSNTATPAPAEFTGLALDGATKLSARVTHYDMDGNDGDSASVDYYVKPYAPPAPTVAQISGCAGALNVDVNIHASENAVVEHSLYCPTTAQYVQADGTLGAGEVFQAEATWASLHVSGLAPETTYYFRARTRNYYAASVYSDWSDCASAATPAAVPDAPTNPTPPDGATSVPISQILDWDDVSGADGYYVHFGTDADPPYVGENATSAWDPGALAYDTSYYWKVIAYNSGGNSSTTVWSFRTIIQAPDAAANPDPADGAAGVSITTDLDWDNSARADGYYLFFGTDADPAYNSTVADSIFDPGVLSNDTTYFWKVIAYNAAGNASTTVWEFFTGAAPVTVSLQGYFDNHSAPGAAFDNNSYSTNEFVHYTWDCSASTTGFYWYFGSSPSPTDSDYKNYTTDRFTESHVAAEGLNYFHVKATDGLQNSGARVYAYNYDGAAPAVSGAHLQSASSHAPSDGYDNAGGITAGTTELYGDYNVITEANPDCTSYTLAVTGGSGGTAIWNDSNTALPEPAHFTGITLSGATKLLLEITHFDLAGQNASTTSVEYFVKPYTPQAPSVTQVGGNWTALDVDVVPDASENSAVEYAVYCETTAQWVQADGSLGGAAYYQTDSDWGTVRVTGLSGDTAYSFKTQSGNYYNNDVTSDLSSSGGATTVVEPPEEPRNPAPPSGAAGVPTNG